MDKHTETTIITSEEQALLGPYSYLLQVDGAKEIRSQLSNAFNAWLKIPDDKLKVIIDIIQMIHNATLLIDDIEDNSNLRWGIPVAHHIYGIPQTINTANYVYFLGLQKAISLHHPDKIFHQEQLLELHRGQGMDIYWRDTNNCPTEDEYNKMVKRKTGGLFGLEVKLMQLFSSNKSDFKPLCDNLGLYFQIRDDYANLKSAELTYSKGFAEDLTEGKFSFPIIHGIRSHPENDQLMSILRQKSHQIPVKKYCIDYLESVGSFQYTKHKLEDLEKEILNQTEHLGGNEIFEQTIKKLSIVYKEG